MKIDTIRIYAEVLEQGLDFKEYVTKAGFTGEILNVYAKKKKGAFPKRILWWIALEKLKILMC